MNISLVELAANDLDPPDGVPWILIENDESGNWYGTGFGIADNGDETMYISKVESDISFHAAVDSALIWARLNKVEVIYIRRL